MASKSLNKTFISPNSLVKSKRRMAGDLPEEVIQHIQSMLNERGAARTSFLSKSWYGAWCTLPDRFLRQCDFWKRRDEFPRYVEKALQRYDDSNLPIKTLWLKMQGNKPLAVKLILKAIKLGVADLKIETDTSPSPSNLLPEEVLQSKTLARLHLSGFIVDLERMKGVIFPNLKSLTLSLVTLHGDLFRDLISRCPLIEEFRWFKLPTTLFDCRIKVEEFDKLEFRKLKYLSLTGLDKTLDYMTDVKAALYRHDLSPKFPCLTNLKISDNHSNHVRICSQSLESITIDITHDRIWNGEFDVPNIRKFSVSSFHLPCLVMKTSSREKEWESYLRIQGKIENPNLWFSSLNQLAKVLSQSQVSLYLCVDIWSCMHHHGYVGDGLAVEELTLHYRHRLSFEFLDSLLWTLRPKLLKIEKNCVFGTEDELDAKEFPQLRSFPLKTFMFDASMYFNKRGYVSYQLD